MVSARQGFQKVYDLPERVLPDWVDTREPTLDEFAAHLIDTSLRAHGFVTLVSVTYLRKGQALREAVKRQLQARIDLEQLSHNRWARIAVSISIPNFSRPSHHVASHRYASCRPLTTCSSSANAVEKCSTTTTRLNVMCRNRCGSSAISACHCCTATAWLGASIARHTARKPGSKSNLSISNKRLVTILLIS